MAVMQKIHFMIIKFSDNDFSECFRNAINWLASYLSTELDSIGCIDDEHIKIFLADSVARVCAMDTARDVLRKNEKYDCDDKFDYDSYYEHMKTYLLSNISIIHGINSCARFLLDHICMPNAAKEFWLDKESELKVYLMDDKDEFRLLTKLFSANQESAFIRISQNSCYVTETKFQFCII